MPPNQCGWAGSSSILFSAVLLFLGCQLSDASESSAVLIKEPPLSTGLLEQACVLLWALLDTVYKAAHISPPRVFCSVSLLSLRISGLSKIVVLWATAAALREAVLPFGILFANRSPTNTGQQNNFCVSWGLIGHHVTLSHFMMYIA